MITWDAYFGIVQILNRVVQEKMPGKYASSIADYVEDYERVRKPLIAWQEEVLFTAHEFDRDALWKVKMGEEVGVPSYKFSDVPIDFSPAEVITLRSAGLW